MILKEYIERLKNSLNHWVKCHFDPETWAENWMMGYEPVEFIGHFGATLKNSYFECNIVNEALKIYVDEAVNEWYQCPKCGLIHHSSDDASDCEEECGFEFENHPDKEDLLFWLEEVSGDEKTAAEWLERMCGSSILWKALEGPCFKAYLEGVQHLTEPIKEEIGNALADIEKAKTPEELFLALSWANHIRHVNGVIVEDYDWELWEFVEEIADEGFPYERYEIEEFLERRFSCPEKIMVMA